MDVPGIVDRNTGPSIIVAIIGMAVVGMSPVASVVDVKVTIWPTDGKCSCYSPEAIV